MGCGLQRGRTSTEDAPRPGRPKSATSDKMIEKVRQVVLSDRRLKLIKIAETVEISKERSHHILTESLTMRKLSARWVPRLLTPEQKLNRAPCHKSRAVMDKIGQLGFQLVPYAPDSPDLAPLDFNLFPNLKKCLAGKRYGSDAEVIAATNAYFEGLDESSYTNGIKALEHRWVKCIKLQRDYVEK